ncbi:MAG: response regulator [Chlamydiales bacterium]|nr:response regulator [Chlamydiales bacterium]
MTVKPQIEFKDARVLVAEDNEFSIEILRYMLSLFGINADLASDGTEAVEKVKEKEYDLLILDIHMPNMDGNETAREIRKMSIKQPVLVALTASVFQKEKEQSMEAGFDDYYNKPLELPGLELILVKYLKEKIVSH